MFTPPRIHKTVGIDLGTTNSVIAVLDATDSSLLVGQDEHGRLIIPSLIGDRLVVGHEARGTGETSPEGAEPPSLPLSSVKRHMGLDRAFTIGGHTLTPPQASARILEGLRHLLTGTLRRAGQAAFGEAAHRVMCDSAIITMPAYFNHDQIEATRLAGSLAGYEVVELLHEPTAAAIYYAWLGNHGSSPEEVDLTYLVYDLGGGTFDVSIIRRHFEDYEVMGVSGDPFLGGDDFDRLLASHLLKTASFESSTQHKDIEVLFDLTTELGLAHFQRLVNVAEQIKKDLTDTEVVERDFTLKLAGPEPADLTFHVRVERSTFQQLIKDKVDRTIECCHEALARARERTGCTLSSVDYIILVGGSSRLPLVRETVRAAFCDPSRPEHVRNPEPLLHEPDLCVAFGAALRAATHGTRYRFDLLAPHETESSSFLELHLTSPCQTRETQYLATGVVRWIAERTNRAGSVSDGVATQDPSLTLPARMTDSAFGIGQLDGGSVVIRSLASGLVEEAFLDEKGTFAQEIELQPETDNVLELSICDEGGAELVRTKVTVRHRSDAGPLGQGVLPTQLITKPLQIEILTRGRVRTKQVLAPVGAPLPGTFHCECRTTDQSGRVVVPIFEENRIIKQMVIEGLDPGLPVGSPVEVEAHIDVKHEIRVQVRVRQGKDGLDHVESAVLEPPPPPALPTPEEVHQVWAQIQESLGRLVGSLRTRCSARATQVEQNLREALHYHDEPRAIQRMAELRDLVHQIEHLARTGTLDPPWPRFTQLVQHCLDRAQGTLAQDGGWQQDLVAYIHTQERYAEQAYNELNQSLYRECFDNLVRYARYLEQLLDDALPRPARTPERSPEEEAKAGVEHFRQLLSTIWKKVREQKASLSEGTAPGLRERLVQADSTLAEIARKASGLNQRLKEDPVGVIREVRRLSTEIGKVENLLEGRQQGPPDKGLLEGTL